LLAVYHKDKANFRANVENLGMGNDERLVVSKTTPGESMPGKPSFYAFVTEHCTCGTCYKTFARSDRIPWRSSAKSNKFVSAKHGTVFIKNCPVSRYEGIGYIWDPKVTSKPEVEPCQPKLTKKVNLNDTLKIHKNDTLKSSKKPPKPISSDIEKENDAEYETWKQAPLNAFYDALIDQPPDTAGCKTFTFENVEYTILAKSVKSFEEYCKAKWKPRLFHTYHQLATWMVDKMEKDREYKFSRLADLKQYRWQVKNGSSNSMVT